MLRYRDWGHNYDLEAKPRPKFWKVMAEAVTGAKASVTGLRWRPSQSQENFGLEARRVQHFVV